ncbi:MAG: hypothetical protein GWN58_60545 [Anaerolineae bacterium]|nr:hypothetical protein [Anaerolineae bacterium]
MESGNTSFRAEHRVLVDAFQHLVGEGFERHVVKGGRVLPGHLQDVVGPLLRDLHQVDPVQVGHPEVVLVPLVIFFYFLLSDRHAVEDTLPYLLDEQLLVNAVEPFLYLRFAHVRGPLLELLRRDLHPLVPGVQPGKHALYPARQQVLLHLGGDVLHPEEVGLLPERVAHFVDGDRLRSDHGDRAGRHVLHIGGLLFLARGYRKHQ